MNIFELCAAILQDFGHPKNRCWHTQLNVCEKEEFPCFLYLIQIFAWILLKEIRQSFYKMIANWKQIEINLKEWSAKN